MATRQNIHRVEPLDAASILAEADRTSRKASTSSERARRVSEAATMELDNVRNVFRTYQEAQEAFDAAMDERLQLEMEIEEHERELAEA